ncbi:hypothetical protein NEAUS06_1353 [Nematocida ausubeli]|nr:hypothetical protein NEAUS06_1353 [Nematocida ausubeli]
MQLAARENTADLLPGREVSEKRQNIEESNENLSVSLNAELLKKGHVAVGMPRRCRTLSFMHAGCVYFAVGRAVVRVENALNAESAPKSTEMITTAESSISALSIENEVISIGTLSGEIILMTTDGQVIYKQKVDGMVHHIHTAQDYIYISVLYALIKVKYKNQTDLPEGQTQKASLDRYNTVARMNDIIMHVSAIQQSHGEVLMYANSNTLFVNKASVTYFANVVFAKSLRLSDSCTRIITGLTNRKVYIYEYKEDKLTLLQIIYAQGLIYDGIIVNSHVIVLSLSNSINIYNCRKTAECVGMIGPYDEEIIKVYANRQKITEALDGLDETTEEIAHIIMSHLYIALNTGGMFKYATDTPAITSKIDEKESFNNENDQRVHEESNEDLEKKQNNLLGVSPLCNTPGNIISGCLEKITHLSIVHDCIIAASGPVVRIFCVENESIREIFRPVVDGFPINSVIAGWQPEDASAAAQDFTLITNSNNILKVFKPTRLFNLVSAHTKLKEISQRLAEHQASHLSAEGAQLDGVECLSDKALSLQSHIKNQEEAGASANTPYTATKQELSLTTLAFAHPSSSEREYIEASIGTDPGLAANHFIEVDKIFGFPFEISTFIKHSDSMVVLACKSSQKAFANLFVLNSRLETVQKIFSHTKTITHILSSHDKVFSIGKDRQLCTYRVSLGRSTLPQDELTPAFQESDLGLELYSRRTDHKKEVLAASVCGTELLTSSRDKTLNTYDIQDNDTVLVKTQTFDEPVSAICIFTLDGCKYTVLGNTTGYLTINEKTQKLHNSPITHIHQYHHHIITATEEGLLRITRITDLL